MKLEDQVTSLELSKTLKELGFNQTSIFKYIYAYHPTESTNAYTLQYCSEEYTETPVHEKWTLTSYAAFTASELLEILPPWTDISKRDDDFHCRHFHKNRSQVDYSFSNKSVDALVLMLIHLIENSLLDIPK